MEEVNPDIFFVKSNDASKVIVEQLKTYNCNSIINKLIANQASVSIFELDHSHYNSYEKLWLLNLPSIQKPFLIGSKLNQTDGKKPKFDFNPEFTKILTLSKPLNIKLERNSIVNDTNKLQNTVTSIDLILKGSAFFTIDITIPNLVEVLKHHSIDPFKMIKTYNKKIPSHVDLDSMRHSYIDRVSFCIINGLFLLIGYSKKAKERKRIYKYNNGFIQYITQLPNCNPLLSDKNKDKSSLTLIGRKNIHSTLELNSILDKIAIKGMLSLTHLEKTFLKNW